MKRILAMLLVTLFLFSALCGCNPTEQPPTPPDDGGDDPTVTPPDDGGNDDDPKPPTNTDLTFSGDFRVLGPAAADLVAALEKAGVAIGGSDAAKVIYAGEDSADIATQAKKLATEREANYNDYAIVAMGEELALYGASESATEAAIAYLVSTYVKEGKIVMPKDTKYSAQPENGSISVGANALSALTVVSENASCAGIAATLAKDLSVFSGYEIPYANTRARRAINLIAENSKNENDFSTDYTVSATENELTITAKTRASLSFAVQDFAAKLENGKVYEAGYTAYEQFTMVHTDATDTALFKYCGTWQATDEEHPTAMVSYWNAAYVEIDFTGNAIAIEFARKTTFQTKLDGGNYSSKVTLDAGKQMVLFAEGDGVHTLRIYANDRNAHMYFAGVSVSDATTLSRTPDKKHYIQFVGDSISDSTSSFSHRVGDVLGWDFSVTALSGIALETDYGYWKHNNGYKNGVTTPGSMADLIFKNFGVSTLGMEEAFFKLGIAQEYMTGEERDLYANQYLTPNLDYNFEAGYTPDIVFIFLGTNDELSSVNHTERFKTAYMNYVERILEVYGEDTQICVLQALTHSSMPNNENNARYTVIRNAAYALMDTYPENVTFIDRDIITTWNVEIGADTTHPTGNGYDTLTEKIAALLKEYYK